MGIRSSCSTAHPSFLRLLAEGELSRLKEQGSGKGVAKQVEPSLNTGVLQFPVFRIP